MTLRPYDRLPVRLPRHPRIIRSIPMLLLAPVILSGFSLRHGLDVVIEWHPPALIATCTWSTGGGVVVGAAVEVHAPGAGEEPYQKGETDRNGRFSFLPDTAGEWRLVVDDGMGHRETSRFSLPPDFQTAETITSEPVEENNLRMVGLAVAGILIVVIAIVIIRRASPAGT